MGLGGAASAGQPLLFWRNQWAGGLFWTWKPHTPRKPGCSWRGTRWSEETVSGRTRGAWAGGRWMVGGTVVRGFHAASARVGGGDSGRGQRGAGGAADVAAAQTWRLAGSLASVSRSLWLHFSLDALAASGVLFLYYALSHSSSGTDTPSLTTYLLPAPPPPALRSRDGRLELPCHNPPSAGAYHYSHAVVV